jgi:23S rRNA (guanosine2251-2'-O)-methyltransferase
MREWICGRNPVYEVLRAGRRQPLRLNIAQGGQEKGRLAEIIQICQHKKIPIERLPRQRLDILGSGHQGVVLEASGYSYAELQDILVLAHQRQQKPFILILDALHDPQNLGTLLRTAEIVGEHLLITQSNLAQSIETLKKAGVWVVGLDSNPDALPPGQIQLDGALALVVGNEGEGMRSLVRDSCDWLLRLPMRGKIESLNAAVAGSVALYMVWQARGFAEG